MATGQQAFSGSTSAVIFDSILHKAPVSPVRLNPELPQEFEHIINKALEKDRKLRYQHASDLVSDLQRLKRDSDSGRSAVTAAMPQHKKKRSGIIAAAAIVVVAALAAAGYFYLHRAPKLTAKDAIVLAEFTNTTGDQAWDQTLRQGLAIKFEESPYFRIISGNLIVQGLRLAEKPPDTRLTGDVARQICPRVGATVTIEGSIADLGEQQYVLGLNAVNCETGETIAREQVTADGKAKVIGALGDAASRLRRKLGESRASLDIHNVPLVQATTPSLEALQAFSLADQAFYRMDFTSVFTHAERAISLDPGFPMALSLLGSLQMSFGQIDQGLENVRKAYELRDRVTEFERYSISNVYFRDGLWDFTKALEILQRWNLAYPHKAFPLFILGIFYTGWLGQYEEALPLLQESLQLEPTALSYEGVIRTYYLLNRLDEARKLIQEARSRKIENVFISRTSYFIAVREKDTAGAAANEADARLSLGPEYFEALQESYRGRLSSIRDLPGRITMSPSQAVWRAWVLALSGYASEAKIAGMDAGKMAKSMLDRGNSVLTLARTGDAAGAQKLAADLNRQYPEATWVRFCILPMLRATLALREGRPQEALEALAAASPYEKIDLNVAYLRGEAYLAARQGSQAAAEFRKMLDRPSTQLFDVQRDILPHLGLGRAYAMQGDTAMARKSYQDFLTLWKDADPDIPILKQAKAEYNELQKKELP
jgi:tetratricopeptide (TPR) repeat protein